MGEVVKAYIVEGRTGEYSDHRTWPVCGYMNEAAAKAKVTQLEERIREVVATQGEDLLKQYYHEGDDLERHKVALAYIGDPNMQYDYTGTSYHYYPVDIVDLGWPEIASTQ